MREFRTVLSVPVWCDPESAFTAALHWNEACTLPMRKQEWGNIISVRGGEDSCFLSSRKRGVAFLASAIASVLGWLHELQWHSECMVLVGSRADLHQLSCYRTADNLAPITLPLLLFVHLPACAYCPALISTSSLTKIRLFSLGCS